MKRRYANPEALSGFTLVEMLAVLALIAILAGVAWPALSELGVKARRSQARAALMQAMQQQERHYTAHGRYAAFSREEAKGFVWYSGSQPGSSSHELQAQACSDATLEECVQLNATPGTPAVNSRAQDVQCGVLTLNSRGERGADGDATLCWP